MVEKSNASSEDEDKRKKPTSSSDEDSSLPPSKKAKTSSPSSDDASSQQVELKILPGDASSATPLHCIYCQKELVRQLRIQCAECKPTCILCINCFSTGVEIKGHLKTHAYHVSDCLSYSLFHPDWTAEEELLLLEGIKMFGMGNWKAVSEHVGSKSEKKCENRYIVDYLKGPNAPLPTDTLSGESQLSSPEATATKEDNAVPAVPSSESSITGDGVTGGAPPSPSSIMPGADLAGYMPLRGDFDVEYDNNAELILAEMEFLDTDHPTETELKLRIVDIYNGKLDERERRKAFVIERGLIDYKKHLAIERRRPKEERDLVARLRPFARFHSHQEHTEFVNGLLSAMRFRKRIATLQQYRALGIRTLVEADEYEAEKRKKESEEALAKQRESSSYLYETSRTMQSGGRDRANRWANRERGATTPVGKSNAATPETTATTARRGSSTVKKSKGGKPVDVSDAPGAELLSAKEIELCGTLRLLPKHYMVIKDTLIRESFRLGYLDKKSARQMIKIDVNKTGKIYDFFVSVGWVSSRFKKKDSSASTLKT